MAPTNDDVRALGAALDAATGTLDTLAHDLGVVRADVRAKASTEDVRRVRRRVTGTIVASVLIVLMLGAFGVLPNRAAVAHLDAERCRSNKAQHQLWDGVIGLSSGQPSQQTPEQRADQLRQFQALLDKAFPTKGCR